jgi:hypothetical protein
MGMNSIRRAGAVLLTGIMAASKDGLTGCEGDSVYASLHTGTTAWFILAPRRINPLSATTPVSAQ